MGKRKSLLNYSPIGFPFHMIMSATSGDGDGVINAAIIRGGPIYINNFVGPLTTVPEFESTLLHELEELKLDLCVDSSLFSTNDDILVDELKMFSNEDLVEMALKETLKMKGRRKVPWIRLRSTQMLENNLSLSSDSNSQLESSGREREASAALELLNGGNCCDGTLIDTTKPSKKRRCLKSPEESQSGISSNDIITDNKSKKGKEGIQKNKLLRRVA